MNKQIEILKCKIKASTSFTIFDGEEMQICLDHIQYLEKSISEIKDAADEVGRFGISNMCDEILEGGYLTDD